MIYEVAPDFLNVLRTTLTLELVAMRKELATFPEDAAYLAAVDAEIKHRAQEPA